MTSNLAWYRLSVCFGCFGWEGESLGHYNQVDIISGVVPFSHIKLLLEKRGQHQNLDELSSLSLYHKSYNVTGSLPTSPPKRTGSLPQVRHSALRC